MGSMVKLRLTGSGKFKLLLTAALCWSVGLVNSEANTFIWTNQTASGQFSDFAKWDPTGIPGVNDQANFTNNFAYTLTSFLETGSLTFNGSSGTVTQDIGAGTTWHVSNCVFVAAGNNTTATVVNASGLLAVTNLNNTASLSLGQGAASLGRLIVSGAATTARVDTLIIGNSGIGLMTVSNSAIQVRNVTVGSLAGSRGTMAVAGGSTKVASNLVVATTANSTGNVVVTSGGTLAVTNAVLGVGNTGTVVGGGGVGDVMVSNGTVLASTILLGSTAGGQGSLTIQSGGMVSFPGSNALLSVNSLTVQGGALPVGVLDMVNGTIKVGVVSNGTMTVDGGIANCADVIIGEDTLGTCRMNDGTMTMSSALTVGNGPASMGLIWMNGGNWLSSSRTTIGNNGVGQMTISNGTITLPRVVVSGIGTSANPGTFTIAGGAVYCTNLVVGFDLNSTGTVWVTAGNLSVTNAGSTAQLVVGRSGRGALTLSNGTLIADQLLVTNSTKSTFLLVGGTLRTRNTTVANGAQFVVGDGVTAATLHLLGGVHSFGNGLRIRSSSVLSGCGTINGNVIVDAGGTVLADCGGTLTFTGILTNNGLMRASNGTVLESYSSVVNNGLIDVMTGATNFHSTFINNGSVADASYFRVVSIVKQGNAVNITWTTVGGRSNVVQFTAGIGGSYSNNFNNLSPTIVMPGASLGQTNYLDMGGATNRPARYYRVRLAP